MGRRTGWGGRTVLIHPKGPNQRARPAGGAAQGGVRGGRGGGAGGGARRGGAGGGAVVAGDSIGWRPGAGWLAGFEREVTNTNHGHKIIMKSGAGGAAGSC